MDSAMFALHEVSRGSLNRYDEDGWIWQLSGEQLAVAITSPYIPYEAADLL
jgi:hypothetical protein